MDGGHYEEKKSLKDNDVWEVVNKIHILTGKPLHSKWIFRIKQDGKYKARLVIKGCEKGNWLSRNI